MRVAQLDRASGYGPEGREFESSHAREENSALQGAVDIKTSILGVFLLYKCFYGILH